MLPKNCTKRKHEYRIHEPLSNGQWLNLYFFKCHKRWGETFTHWSISLCISDGIKQANKWVNYKSNLNGKQTGKCGIEGLRKALVYIKEFEKLHLKDILWIDTAGEQQRMRVYSWLNKHCGWYGITDKKNGEWLAFLNKLPKQWKPGMEF